MGAKIFLSHTFHVRNKYLRTHPKPSPAFRMVRLRVILIVSYVFFTLSIFIILLTLSLYRRDRERSFVPALLLSGDHGAPPPLSEIRKNKKMSVGGIAAKRISASSWGQCASFRCSGDKKSTWNHFENSPFVPRRAQPMHIE
jgi:hypothetical protein